MGLSIILVRDIEMLDGYDSTEFEEKTEEIWQSSYSTFSRFCKELETSLPDALNINWLTSGEWTSAEVKNTYNILQHVSNESPFYQQWEYQFETLLNGLQKAIEQNLYVVFCCYLLYFFHSLLLFKLTPSPSGRIRSLKKQAKNLAK